MILIINVLFYFYIARMFLIAAKEKDFSLARFGIGVFVITEYITFPHGGSRKGSIETL